MASKSKNENLTQGKKSKAQQAVGKTREEKRVETRNRLLLRLVTAIVLVFLALFLLLSLVGVQGAVLNLLRDGVRGLFGYGYYLMPPVFLYIAWLLVFKNHEPWRLRAVSLFLVAVLFSSLMQVLICRIDFGGGLSIFRNLWLTGVEKVSGGVIPGLLAQGLIFCLSRVGATPVLLVLLVVFVFLGLNISLAQIIHNRAERKREELEQEDFFDEELPVEVTREMTMEDLRFLGDTMTLPKLPELRKREKAFDFDSTDAEEPAPKRERKKKNVQLVEDDDLVFFQPAKKKEKKKAVSKPMENPFDVPLGDDYAQVVQELAQEEEELMDLPWAPPEKIISDTVPPQEEPQTLTEEELSQGAKEAMKGGKVSRDEAAMAAAQVAMEIEKKTDAEAEEAEAQPYQFPPMTMLKEALGSKDDNTEEMRTNVIMLEKTLGSFGVDIKVDEVVRGPTVTRYEMQLKPGVKMSKITGLHEDIALALGVSGIRVAAVAGKSSVIGIEVPNKITTSVPIREVLSSKEFKYHKSNLAFALGKDIGGNYIVGDIAKMPHMLIAGTTGSGKSVCMNSIIVSLLYRASPEQVRMIMIDPKVVELSIYNGIPHLLIPVVDDPKKAAGALQWAVTEMERRYRLLAEYNVRDMTGYNKLAASDPEMTPMSQIVIVIDELADLMLVAAKEVENSIVRIAQKARAAGMHLVIATQRPSSDVITGLMKSNIPSRIAFAVASAIDSRIILDEGGAEKLVGKGDMLYAPLGGGKPKRLQGCFITDEEVEEVVRFVKQSSEADYSDDILKEIEQNAAGDTAKAAADAAQTALVLDGDELLPDAVEVVLDTKQASVSMLQRRLKLGYAHAARIMDEMEEKGIVGPFEGSKARQLLITREQWDSMVGINPRAVAGAAPEEPELQEDEDVPFDEDE